MSGFVSGSGGPIDGVLRAYANDVRSRAQRAVSLAAVTLKAEIQQQLSKPGQGRYYAKASRLAGSPTPTSNADRTALKKRLAKARKLNALRRSYARNLNRGTVAFGDITRRNVVVGLHRASKPGDPPAPDTGTLKRSAFVERTARGARTGVGAVQALAMEFGTANAGKTKSVRILPRPFMRPALVAARAQLGNVFISTLRARGVLP
jgi:hypothetical protein